MNTDRRMYENNITDDKEKEIKFETAQLEQNKIDPAQTFYSKQMAEGETPKTMMKSDQEGSLESSKALEKSS